MNQLQPFRRKGLAIELAPKEPIDAELEQIQKALYPWLEGFRGEILERLRASKDITLRQEYDFKEIKHTLRDLERMLVELCKWRASVETIINTLKLKKPIVVPTPREEIVQEKIKPKPEERRRWKRGGRILDIKEAAEYLGIAASTIRNMRCDSLIPAFKKGKKLYFDTASLDQWNRTRSNKPPGGYYSSMRAQAAGQGIKEIQ